jgi:hypothetical protein
MIMAYANEMLNKSIETSLSVVEHENRQMSLNFDRIRYSTTIFLYVSEKYSRDFFKLRINDNIDVIDKLGTNFE